MCIQITFLAYRSLPFTKANLEEILRLCNDDTISSNDARKEKIEEQISILFNKTRDHFDNVYWAINGLANFAIEGLKEWVKWVSHTYSVEVVNWKKFSIGKLISRDFDPKSWAPQMIFPLASIWRLKAASNIEAAKSTLLNKSCSNQKILADLLVKLLKFQ